MQKSFSKQFRECIKDKNARKVPFKQSIASACHGLLDAEAIYWCIKNDTQCKSSVCMEERGVKVGPVNDN